MNFNPEDLKVFTMEYFDHGNNDPEEVVQIRYDHYKQRRYSKYLINPYLTFYLITLEKLSIISKYMEQVAMQQKMEKENPGQKNTFALTMNDFMGRPITEGYKTQSRFSISNFTNSKSVNKGF